MDTLWQDVRYGARQLLRNPGFTTVAVLTLALGIGATTAIFSVVNAVLILPLPYKDPNRLVVIWNYLGEENKGQSLPLVAAPDFLDYQEQSQLFADFAAASSGSVSLSEGGDPIQIEQGEITANLLPLLGVEPLLGRNFLPQEDVPDGPNVVILSYGLWQQRFGGDPNVIGQTTSLNDEAYLVVGVLPAGFRLLLPAETWGLKNPRVWTPLQEDYAKQPRNLQSLLVLGRLAHGVTLEQAQAEMNVIAQTLRTNYSVYETAQLRIRAVALQQDVVKGLRPILLILLVAVGFVLLIVCLNIANLLLARAIARRKEFAIRAALGATKATLFRQALTESVLLSLPGGVLGIALVPWGLEALLTIRPADLPRLERVEIDGPVLVFAACTSLLTGVLFGLAPALHGLRPDVYQGLKEGSRLSTAPAAQKLRSCLIIVEVGVSVVLLIGTGLLLRSFVSLQQVRPGFDPARIMTFRLDLPSSRYPTTAEETAFYEELERKTAELPEVENVGLITHLPLTGTGPVWPYAYDEETEQQWEKVTADWRRVTPHYFRALGTRLVAGRFFTSQDNAESRPVLIVDETLAQQAWPNENPVGKRLKVSIPWISALPRRERKWVEVVGVVEHVRNFDLGREIRPQYYQPYLQLPGDDMSVVVRTAGDPSGLAGRLRGVVQSLDRELPVYEMRPMQHYVTAALAKHRFTLMLITLFGFAALFLAAVGMYGVISFAVSQQTHEMGIRMALGAQSRDIIWFVVGRGLALVVTGVLVGLAGALAVTRVLASLLFQVEPTDPLTFGSVPLLLAGVALLASYVPARRAARVDPVIALRYE